MNTIVLAQIIFIERQNNVKRRRLSVK